MADKNIVLQIGDFLGFCDLNGVEAMQTEQVQELENYISACNEAHRTGDSIVPDAIWDRLMEILRKVNPESELCKHIWEDSVEELDDTDTILVNNPMFSIQTVKSFECDEMRDFIKRLPDDVEFDMHFSVKLNGHGIRLKYRNGVFFNARTRARSSAGRDITEALRVVLEDFGVDEIADWRDIDLCEVRGEWLLPFENMETARQYNKDIKSAFSGVASMGRASASEDEWRLLRFVAYEFIADGVSHASKSEEYEFLEDVGFEVPLSWRVEGLTKDTFLEEVKGIISDCEEEVKPNPDGTGGYDYYTDGIVGTIDSNELFRSLGDDGSHYKHGNIALKVGYWEQNILEGYVQCILWTKGKSKLSPVAILGDSEGMVEYSDKHMTDKDYIFNKNEIANWDSLGVISQVGNKVRRIPLYEPSNVVALDAYPGSLLHFRYGGEAGVVPCFEDGTPLVDGRIQNALKDEGDWDLYSIYAYEGEDDD